MNKNKKRKEKLGISTVAQGCNTSIRRVCGVWGKRSMNARPALASCVTLSQKKK
jgi:hypothetical protein